MLYNLFTYFISAIAPLAALKGGKMRRWYLGRRNLLKQTERLFKDNKSSVIWFHCASLGEFEQGREVIEEVRKKFHNHKILLTFFSPSGYEQKKNYDKVDYVLYLPLDTPYAAKRFVRAIKPEIVIFVKYDFWSNLLKAAAKEGAKLYVISAIFNPKQYFFKWYHLNGRKVLRLFSHIFVQNRISTNLLASIDIFNTTISGDTRFDRVRTLSKQSKDIDILEEFTNENRSFTLVAGSTWRADEKLLIDAMANNRDIKFVIAPHEIGNNVEWLKRECEKVGRKVSLYTKGLTADSDVLIIDTIGVLSSAYKYGDIAYIGGGFGAGIHNILEAATYGMPIAFGTNYKRFAEAVELISLSGAESVSNSQELIRWMTSLQKNAIMCRKRADICKEYVEENCGATSIILKHIAYANGITIENEDDYYC